MTSEPTSSEAPMTEMDELLPCPFCGSRLQRQQTSSGHWYEHMGEVKDCYATGSIVFDENIPAWNRRPSRLEAISDAEPGDPYAYAVSSRTGSHIGLWTDEQTAWSAASQYQGSSVKKLYERHTPPAGHVAVPVERLTTVLDEYDAQTKALPLGHEDRTRGASSYNWRRSVVDDIRAMLAAQGGENGP